MALFPYVYANSSRYSGMQVQKIYLATNRHANCLSNTRAAPLGVTRPMHILYTHVTLSSSSYNVFLLPRVTSVSLAAAASTRFSPDHRGLIIPFVIIIRADKCYMFSILLN